MPALPPGPDLRKKSQIQLKKEHVLGRPTASELALPSLALPLPPWCPDFPLIFTSSFAWLASSHCGFSFLRCCSAMFKRLGDTHTGRGSYRYLCLSKRCMSPKLITKITKCQKDRKFSQRHLGLQPWCLLADGSSGIELVTLKTARKTF